MKIKLQKWKKKENIAEVAKSLFMVFQLPSTVKNLLKTIK